VIYKITDNVRVFRSTPAFERGEFGVWHVSKSPNTPLSVCGYLSYHDDIEYATIADTKQKDKFCIHCFPKHFERIEIGKE
jgi:hypothetical protein